jgi:hypothetical protein
MTLVTILRDDSFNPCDIVGPVPVATRSRACVSGRSLARILGSNPAKAWILSVVCCQVEFCVRQ